MCGICGVWGKAEKARVVKMVGAMLHRGPDSTGVFTDEHVCMGMTRLSVIDTTESGRQPMANEQGNVWIVYNGETYNFLAERKILEAKGYGFRSTSDTEVVLRMYEQYGDDFVSRLRGMFALAIYDKRGGRGRERLLLARDPFGIKPLMFTWTGGQLVFASEIKAMLASGLVGREIEPEALRLLLTCGSVYQPLTMVRSVKMLLPAHRMIVEHGRSRTECYWRLTRNERESLRGEDYEERVEETRNAIEASVRSHMVSDVPIGAFLSGGVDSSVLVAMMAKQAGERVKTFSVGFEAEGAGIDESDDAGVAADLFRTDHTRVVVTGSEVRDSIEDIATGLDQPSVDGVNSYFISKVARKAVTVAISGTGGDELFAGYPWFITMLRYESERMNGLIRKRIGELMGRLARLSAFDPLLDWKGGWRVERARRACDFLTTYAQAYSIFGEKGARQLIHPDLRRASRAGRSPHYDVAPNDQLGNADVVDRVTALCLRGYTQNQLLRDIDAVSMSHSLEVRVPFLDVELADLALSLPASDKLKTGGEAVVNEKGTYRETGAKRILVDAARDLLPAHIDLQSKRGFRMPFDAWLRGPLRAVMLDTLSGEEVRRRGLLSPAQVERIRRGFAEGKTGWYGVWLLMMLELWCRHVLEAR